MTLKRAASYFGTRVPAVAPPAFDAGDNEEDGAGMAPGRYMNTHTRIEIPRLRSVRPAHTQPEFARRGQAARPLGVMTPGELRAEVLALIG